MTNPPNAATETTDASIGFRLNDVDVAVRDGGSSLLMALREQLGVVSAKDGCAPQGQCGCCTVLIDGEPRVACVTPVARVAGRSITTVEGLSDEERASLSTMLCASGGAQCGFCTPGIVMRLVRLTRSNRVTRGDVTQALAAHLCRCTGWLGITDAFDSPAPAASSGSPRDWGAAGERARLEGGVPQRVDPSVSLGDGGFADDGAPRDALVAVPSDTGDIEIAGVRYVVGESLDEARAKAGKVQGRRAPQIDRPPLDPPSSSDIPVEAIRLSTQWVEPAYLEPDASWCLPGGEPASPLANGGAFGGKSASLVAAAARQLADRFGQPVRVLFAREDVVRFGPKRPPIGAAAWIDGDVCRVVVRAPLEVAAAPTPYRLGVDLRQEHVAAMGPPVSNALRAAGWAEVAVLVEGAIDAAGLDRRGLLDDPLASLVALDSCVRAPSGAMAGARIDIDDAGRLVHVRIRVAAGDPLDDVVLRSYVTGAVHMGLGWVLSEGINVDGSTGEIHDLTIRSFGIIRAKHMPALTVEIVDDDRGALAGASDAVFAAVAAATWNAIGRPPAWPARTSALGRSLAR